MLSREGKGRESERSGGPDDDEAHGSLACLPFGLDAASISKHNATELACALV